MHKINYLKSQLKEATSLQNKGLISNIERVYIHLQIFKELIKVSLYLDANVIAFFKKEVNNLVQIIKNEQPEILTA